MRAACFLAVLLAITSRPVPAQTAPAATPACAADSTYHVLDFWVGEWRVTVDGKVDGTNRVEKILGGCAMTETWHGADGHDGHSLLYVTPFLTAKRWNQVWVTDQARVFGGTKEKSLVATYPDGGVRFQGELVGPRGRVVIDRATLTPMPDGTIRQVIELSLDGGSTWQQNYQATYTRIKP